MDELTEVLRHLNQTRRDLEAKLDRVKIAIATLQRIPKRAELSAAGRRKVSQGVKASWREWRKEHGK